MNITLFKKHDDLFAPDILHSYWVTPIADASGLYSNWKDFSNYSEEELENLKFDVNPTTISIPNKEIVNGTGMFRSNQLIRSVDMDFPNMNDITWMFAFSHLEDITADFSAVTDNNGGIFAQCPKLKTVRCNFQNLENRVMNDTNGINDYSFTFDSCPSLETVECNFGSLKNGNYLFDRCSKLINFDCELDSLETAVNFCTKAKLSTESVGNIANKIKTHNPNETHRIDLGLGCVGANDYIFGWSSEVNKIKSKNWDVHVYSSSGEELSTSGYENTLSLSASKIFSLNSLNL